MDFTYEHSRFSSLTGDEIHRLYELTNNYMDDGVGGSYMRNHLRTYQSYPNKRNDLIVELCRDNGFIVGWCTIGDVWNNEKFTMATYVDKKYRKRGIGTTLADRMAKRTRRRDIILFPWNEAGAKLYLKVEEKNDRNFVFKSQNSTSTDVLKKAGKEVIY